MNAGAGAPGSRRGLRRRAAAWIVAAAVAVAASLEPVRRALSRVDPYLPFALLALGLACAAAVSLRGPAGRRFGRGASRLCQHLARHGLALSLLAFLVPVWAAWELRPPAPLSAYAALFGRIPWSDAANYHAGALRLVDRGTLDGFNQRRPLNASLLAVRLAAGGGDLGSATVLQAAFAGMAAFLAAGAVAARFGVPSALVFLGCALGFARPSLATTLSETLGFALGCLGLALALGRTARRTPGWTLAVGIVGLALAQEARPGAVLVLPLLLAAAVAASAKRWLTLAALGAAVLLAAAVPATILRLHGAARVQPQSNFASIVLALASGENGWSSVLEARQERLAGLSESDGARLLYAEAWEHVRQHPQTLAAGLARAARSYQSDLPGHLVETLALPGARWPAALALGATLVMAVAGLARGHAGPAWIWAAAAAGMLLSAPFVYEAGGMRVFAATDALLAAFLALGATVRRGSALGCAAPARSSLVRERVAAALLTLVVGAALLGPTLARAATPRRELPPAPDGSVVVRGRPIAVVVSPPSLVPPCAGVRVVSRRAFLQGVDPIGPDEANRLGRRRPPFAFAVAYDPAAGVDRHLVGPAELACADAAFLLVRTRPYLGSSLIEDVLSFEPLETPEGGSVRP